VLYQMAVRVANDLGLPYSLPPNHPNVYILVAFRIFVVGERRELSNLAHRLIVA